jgi:hypothetical protein
MQERGVDGRLLGNLCALYGSVIVELRNSLVKKRTRKSCGFVGSLLSWRLRGRPRDDRAGNSSLPNDVMQWLSSPTSRCRARHVGSVAGAQTRCAAQGCWVRGQFSCRKRMNNPNPGSPRSRHLHTKLPIPYSTKPKLCSIMFYHDVPGETATIRYRL